MERWLESLLEVLRQTEALYERLLLLIEMQKNAALAANIVELTTTVAEAQDLIGQLRGLDQQRGLALQDLAGASRVPAESMTVSQLIAQTEGADREQLRHSQRRLNQLVLRVRQSNAQCRMLVGHCLRLVHHSLGFFQHRMEPTPVYGAAGDLRTANGAGGRLLSGSI